MTDQQTTDQTATGGHQPPADVPGTPPATGATGDTTGQQNGAPAPASAPESGTPAATDTPNAEAARYRTRLRETEAAHAATTAKLDAMRQAQVDRIAAQHLAVPADLAALGGVTLADMLNEDGDVDPQKVRDAAAALLDTRPGLAAQKVSTRLSDAVTDAAQRVNPHTGTETTDQSKIDHFNKLAPYLNTEAFTGEDGNVDPEKVHHFVNTVMPERQPWPDMGAGRRGSLGRNGPTGWGEVLDPNNV